MKRKIFLMLIAFCGTLIILLWLMQIVFLDDFYEGIKVAQLKRVGTQIKSAVNSEYLGSIMTRLSDSEDIYIEVDDASGNTLLFSGSENNISIINISPYKKTALLSVVKSTGGTLIEYYDSNQFISATYPFNNPTPRQPGNKQDFFSNDKFYGWITGTYTQKNIVLSISALTDTNEERLIILNSVISPVDATVQTLRIQLIIVTLVMLLFSLLLAEIISGFLSRPITKINGKAKEIAAGNLNVVFDTKGYKEIRELSETLNYTVSELSKVENLRRELISNISHDLRTPLTLISGYGEIMRDIPGENNTENIQVIIDESKRLTSLVNNILDLSKLQSGTQQFDMCDLDITKLVISTIGRFSKFCEQDGYSIEFTDLTGRDEVIVYADELRISQVLYNLLTNAINYTGEDRKVFVVQSIQNANTDNESIKICISDTGEGISPDNINQIWDRYYKEDKAHKRSVTGSGIGLSIVKSVLQIHKGATYGVVSEPGKGSTFWFTLKTKIKV